MLRGCEGEVGGGGGRGKRGKGGEEAFTLISGGRSGFREKPTSL